MVPFPRVNILGVGISAINLQQAVEVIDGWVERRECHYLNVCTVHTIMECQQDARLRDIVNHDGLAVPDGMPLAWLGRLHGHRTVGRVYGPDLMLELCRHGQARGYRHFFYGGFSEVAQQLSDRLRARYPDLIVAGIHTSSDRATGADEDPRILDAINASGADIVWVGLGTPKQDYWVGRHRAALRAPVLIPVGAAFNFHAGLLPQAPRWMQQSGLEWFFRLLHEPRRLAYRYLVYNPLFVAKVLLQLAGLRSYPRVDSSPVGD